RVAKQQLPVVVASLPEIQHLGRFDETRPEISKVDIILEDASSPALRRTETALRRIAQSYGYLVSSAEARLRQIRAAEQQTGFILLILSTVALFTAFFVILSTLSMGMIERIGMLGTLRCLGATRSQIAALVLAEAIPLGVFGILLGIPVGLGLARL